LIPTLNAVNQQAADIGNVRIGDIVPDGTSGVILDLLGEISHAVKLGYIVINQEEDFLEIICFGELLGRRDAIKNVVNNLTDMDTGGLIIKKFL